MEALQNWYAAPPDSLTRYMVPSAFASSVSGSSPSAGYMATPMLVVSRTSSSPIANGSWMASMTF